MSSSLNLQRKLHGKLFIRSKIKLNTRKNLSLAYTPGVAEVVNYIYKNKKSVYDLTIKCNSIAVVTDGSAVLGLGNVGPEAALPVMEGKCAIFKEFAGIDAYPICLNTQKTDEIVSTIKNISPGFAAINLEDISAPRCFEIENSLQNLGIPVMHDDQHATAVVVLAGLINATRVVNKKLKDCKVVIVGAGAAGTAITKLLNYYGIKKLLILDSQGIISSKRNDLTAYKKELLSILPNISETDLDCHSGLPRRSAPRNDLKIATEKADILIGVSVKNIFTREIINSMNKNPIVFALANPDPEIIPSQAQKFGVKIIATGRSDYPNQINNALVFPGFFKGLIEKRIKQVTMEMKLRAAINLAGLVKKPKTNYIIPSIFDKRVVPTIAHSLE
ncbi:NADP-dependent malic enzyme [Candidatus Microgenomates bacterium]|nr:NADP-dependent malic enzyme [Candidatus Microgenomates bacterium]